MNHLLPVFSDGNTASGFIWKKPVREVEATDALAAAMIKGEAANLTGQNNTLVASYLQPHHTVAELSERWHMDLKVVRRLFADEPGVIRFGAGGRRTYGKVHLRIPADVAARVYAGITSR